MSDEPKKFGRTIQLFLVDGSPNGLMIASLHGWTGSVLVCRQTTFAKLLQRPEVDRTGVYLLYGPDPTNPLRMRAYVGEADSVKSRIAQSAGQRDFWEIAVAITTSDEALTKGHVRYLEARIIELVKFADRVSLDNVQEPPSQTRRLPEADRANMEAFLDNLKVVLPVVGIEALKVVPKTAQAPSTENNPSANAGEVHFEIRHKSGVKARSFEADGDFIVTVGSESLKDTGGVRANYTDLKDDLIESGILIPDDASGRYIFKESFAFRSPSAAAAIVLDRNANGRVEWKVVGQKMTYHEWQSQAVDGAIENE